MGEKKCGNGLHFDVKLKVCNYPEQANCQFYSRGNIFPDSFPEEQNSRGNKKIESSFENSITEISKTTKPTTPTTTTTTYKASSLSTTSTETIEESNALQLPDYDV